jgi:hypothetical protein
MEDFAGGAVKFREIRRSNDSRRTNPPARADRERNAASAKGRLGRSQAFRSR